MADSYKPTKRMASAARRGLRLREKYDRGGTKVGVDRAHQLADQSDLSEKDVRDMHAYFARHKVDKPDDGKGWDTDSDPTAGFVAWLLWGGDAGRDWAQRKAEKIKDADDD